MRYCRSRDVVELLCDPAPGRLDDCGLGSAHFLWTASPSEGRGHNNNKVESL